MRHPIAWPAPADPDAAARLLERFAEHGRARRSSPRTTPAMLRASAAAARSCPTCSCASTASLPRVFDRRGRTRRWTTARAALDGLAPREPARGASAPGCAQAKRQRGADHRAGRYRRRLGAGAGHRARCRGWPRPRSATRSTTCCSPRTDAGEIALPDPARSRAGQRPDRARHGQAGRRRAELFQRYRPRPVLRSRRAPEPARRDRRHLHTLGARSGCHHGGARRGRLRLPHRSAPAPRPGRHAARRRAARRARLLREHGPELGARGHDQGAPGGRRPGARAGRSWRRSARSSGAAAWISPPSPTSTP